MLRYLTAGESHGKLINAILEGVPSGLKVTGEEINNELRRRQQGYGRGGRMKIERDEVEITAGVRFGITTGAPLSMIIRNRDWENWKSRMSILPRREKEPPLTLPRPGHADLAGGLKYLEKDMRNILERSSARETACRVAVGTVARKLLKCFDIRIISTVLQIGNVRAENIPTNPAEVYRKSEKSDVRCADSKAAEKMRSAIDEAKKNGDSLGGVFQIIVTNPPPGLGNSFQWDKKLDARLAFALMSIQAIKGVEIGAGFKCAELPGSKVHDEIFYRKPRSSSLRGRKTGGFYRRTNNAGGIEGGISNGENIIVNAVMKPIPTLVKSLRSVDLETAKTARAAVERSDVCAVPAASVVGEAVVAYEIANAFLEKFGGDSLTEIKKNFKLYIEAVNRYMQK
ncbi:MAG: chorismate synthase [Candidatus Schekmanbacteria bacterium]|nr:MAG: chorismate synthase [Candidatus Schekmanbacteria bacterium]